MIKIRYNEGEFGIKSTILEQLKKIINIENLLDELVDNVSDGEVLESFKYIAQNNSIDLKSYEEEEEEEQEEN